MKKFVSVLFVFLSVFLVACASGSVNDGSPQNSGETSLEDNSIGEQDVSENLILGPGTYTVGEDIAPGVYDCIANSGFGVLRGDVAACGPAGFIQTMGSSSATIGGYSASVDGTDSYQNLTLADGDVIYIEMSLYVEFVPKAT